MQLDKIAILAKKVTLEFLKIADPYLKQYDLTGAQYRILKYLLVHDGEDVRQVDLERYFSLTNPTTTGLVDQLVKKGFVTREANPNDARSRLLALTDEAREMKDLLYSIGDELENRLTVALSDDEKAQTVALLKKLLSAFE